MNVLLLYKGEYGSALRGPELRYVSLAQELAKSGHKVVLCGRSAEPATLPSAVEFIATSQLFSLAKAFFTARLLVLHGGGPVVLLLALLAGILGKRVVLDAYVPHWIELEALAAELSRVARIKILIKSYFNVLRGLFAALVFDGIVAANRRQLDLYRGMMSPFTLTRDFSRIAVVPFGCSPVSVNDTARGRQLLAEFSDGKVTGDDFVIGWLGGAYGWFDLNTVLAEVAQAISNNPLIKLVFFGVPAERQLELLAQVPPRTQVNIVFLPWVDFAERFNYWAGFDVSLVWGAQSVENDYASRTRNFDCLTLGLPIVQNWDPEWGPRLKESGAGQVTDAEHLSEVLVELSLAPDKLATMRSAMHELAFDFYWPRFAKQLLSMTELPLLTLPRRLSGLVAFVLLLPAVLVMFLYYVIQKHGKSALK